MYWSKVDILAYTKTKGDILRWVAHAGLLFGIVVGPSNYWWVSLAVYFWFASIGLFVGQHRYFAHKSFSTSKFWETILNISGTLASLTSTFGYIVKHREHHKHADTDMDPHSPHHMSTWKAWTLGLKDDKYELRLAKDWIRNKMLMHTHEKFFAYIGAYVLLLALIDPMLVIYAYLIPVSLCVWATGAFNTWGHGKGMQWLGYRTWDTKDKSVNHHLVNLITFGEGWHNNHHADPGCFVHGNEKWWEWDLNAQIIKAIRK
tara:strand:- start:188 stop:967 length:780 start_codon:yes stop_codon:yes gene_type:complete